MRYDACLGGTLRPILRTPTLRNALVPGRDEHGENAESGEVPGSRCRLSPCPRWFAFAPMRVMKGSPPALRPCVAACASFSAALLHESPWFALMCCLQSGGMAAHQRGAVDQHHTAAPMLSCFHGAFPLPFPRKWWRLVDAPHSGGCAARLHMVVAVSVSSRDLAEASKPRLR